MQCTPIHLQLTPQDRAIGDRKGEMNFPLWIFLLLLLLPTEEGAGEKDDEKRRLRKHCPVSHILDPHINGYFSYPVNIWGPDFLSGVMTMGMGINCTSIEINQQVHFDRFHTCISSQETGKSFCPVHKQNFIDAIKRSNEWTPSKYLCDIRRLLRSSRSNTDEAVVNLIVLGGSVTAGQFTEGYYCKTCSATLKNKDDWSGHTNWASYLDFWLKYNKMKHVKLHFLAVHGYASAMMNEVIVDKLHVAGLHNLSASDIVLVDHSYNDGLYLSLSKVLPLQRGLEGLIRKILDMSVSLSSLPRIILLETLSYLPTHLPFYQDYQKIYTQIAKHYQLPIWSIRDAVNSEYPLLNQSSYHKYMRHDEEISYDNHPGWHEHLFYADMIASLLTHREKKCRLEGQERASTSSASVAVETHTIPPALLQQNSTRSCNHQVKPLLDISAQKVWSNQLEGVIGKYETEPAWSWKIRDEARGRIGWIQENTDEIKAIKPDSNSSSIIFHLDDKHDTFGKNGKDPHLIQLQFLRTYKNAGAVKIFICGNLIVNGDGSAVKGDKIDALWGSYRTYKYSLPEMELIVFPDFGFRCKNPMDKTIRIEYVRQIPCREKTVRRHNRDANTDECQAEAEARTNLQKFKVISIKVCELRKNQ